MNHVGIVGYGTVGRLWFDVIPWETLSSQVSIYDPYVDELPAEVRVFHPRELGNMDLLLLFVPGSVTSVVTEEICASEGPPPNEVLDFSSSSPEGKRRAAELFSGRGVRYVDVTILGAVGVSGVQTPLALAGDAPSDFAKTVLTSSQAPLTTLECSTAGDAARLKLVRSIVTKGLEALAVEAHTLAHHFGIQEAYARVFRDIDEAGFTAVLNSMVDTHSQHWQRRGEEVREILAMLEKMKSDSALLCAVADNFETGPLRPE